MAVNQDREGEECKMRVKARQSTWTITERPKKKKVQKTKKTPDI